MTKDNIRVLVADDSGTMRKVIIRSLNAVGIKDVTEAADGQQAIDRFGAGHFDLVLTDWNMPNKTGLQVIEEIRAENSQVPIIMVTTSVFSTMLSCRLERGELTLHCEAQPEYEISGTIGLSGKAVGTVVLSLDKATALSATEAMLGERPETIDDSVVDAVGELTNMIAGAAKAKLEQYDMSVSLPNVIVGRNHVIQFPSRCPPIRIPFHCEWGQLGLIVGLAEVSQPTTIEHARQGP